MLLPPPVPEPPVPSVPVPICVGSWSCAACAWAGNGVKDGKKVVNCPWASVDIIAVAFGTLIDVANVLPPAEPIKDENDSKDPSSGDDSLAPGVVGFWSSDASSRIVEPVEEGNEAV